MYHLDIQSVVEESMQIFPFSGTEFRALLYHQLELELSDCSCGTIGVSVFFEFLLFHAFVSCNDY